MLFIQINGTNNIRINKGSKVIFEPLLILLKLVLQTEQFGNAATEFGVIHNSRKLLRACAIEECRDHRTRVAGRAIAVIHTTLR